MNSAPQRFILTVLACLATGPAFAAGKSVFTGKNIGPVAELSADERAWMRERWQKLPPEERDFLRREMREEWSDLPPEARQQYRHQLKQRLEKRHEQRNEVKFKNLEKDDDGYGRGYGSRNWRDQDFNDVPGMGAGGVSRPESPGRGRR